MIDPLFVASGFGVGLLVGMTGVGGGSLMTPLLVLLMGVAPATAVGTDLLYASLTKMGGAWAHGRRNNIDWRICGLLAAAAVAASLLVAPIIPVLLLWVWLRERTRFLWLILGLSAGLLPLFVFLLAAPHQTIRDVIGFHLIDRPSFGWRYNLGELARWLLPTQGSVLTVVAIASLQSRKQSAIRLCALIALVLGLVLLLIKATASFYFVVLTPFLSILAASWLTDRIARNRERGALLSGATIVLYLVGLTVIGRFRGAEAPYREVRQLARAIEACAPSGNFYANQATYFEAATLPPSHMENPFAPTSLPDSGLASGAFDAVLIGADNPKVVRYRLAEKYAQRTTINYSLAKMLLFCGPLMPR